MKKAINKINNWLLSPLFIFPMISIFIFMVINHFSLSMIDVFTHFTVFIICISFYAYHIASKDFISDLLILVLKNDFSIDLFIQKYFEFNQADKRHLSFQSDSVMIWLIILFYCTFFMKIYDLPILFCIPISFTLFISICIDNLYEFFYFKKIFDTKNFFEYKKFRSETDEEFEKRLIKGGLYSDYNYFKYLIQHNHNDSWNTLKFYLAIIIFLPLLFL